MKKIISCLLFLFLASCQVEYVVFHDYKKEAQDVSMVQETLLKTFSLDDLEELSDTTLQATPDLKFLEELVEKINSSQQRVWVEVYIFTETRLQKALIQAYERWVDVKVILEKNVYKAPSMNKKAFQNFEKHGIPVVWSNAKNYALNHTKMMIVDDEAVVSTGNYSYSSFRYNREFFLIFADQKIIQILSDIFLKDFVWEKYETHHPNLILSPFSTRTKFEYLLGNAQKKIQMYSLNFSDSRIKQLLIDKHKSWVQVEIIFPDDKKVDSNSEILQDFRKAGISFVQVSKPPIHAKSILVDEKYLYVGSVNFSSASIERNREIGFLLKNPEIIKEFLKIFQTDF